MLDVDDRSRRYGNTLPCHLNLKSPSLLEAIGKPPQLFDELFHRIVLLDVTFASILLGCHSQSPLITLWIFQVPSQCKNRSIFQPNIATGKQHENIHEQEHELEFHFFSFLLRSGGRTLQWYPFYSIAPNQPLRVIHLTSSSTGEMVSERAKTITQSISGRLKVLNGSCRAGT